MSSCQRSYITAPESGGGLARSCCRRLEPELLRADAQAMHDRGECVPLDQPLGAKCFGEVAAKQRDVAGTARHENPSNLARRDPGFVQRLRDRLPHEIELRPDHRLESGAAQLEPQVQRLVLEMGRLRI